MNLARPALVIFDCDGTLVDSEVLVNRVTWEKASQIGISWTEQEMMDRLTGHTWTACLRIFEEELGHALPDGFVDEVNAETDRRLAESVEEIPGATALVKAVKAKGIKVCVASNGEHAKMQITLGRTGLMPLFDGHVYSAVDDPVKNGKPDPELFLYAADKLDVAPADCLVVEDSKPGAAAGDAAGMQVVRYHLDGDNRIDDLSALTAIVEAW